MNTLENRLTSPNRSVTLNRNMSSPKLSKATLLKRWDTPVNSLSGMQELRQEHFYIEKLKIQRERMELLKVQFEKKDAEIESMAVKMGQLTQMYEEAMGYRKKYEQLSKDFQLKLIEFESMSSQLTNAKTQIDVFEVELNRMKSDTDRLINQLDSITIELQNERTRCSQIQRHYEHAIRETDLHSKRHRSEAEALKSKWAQMRTELDSIRKENHHLSQVHQQSVRENDHLKQQIAKISTQLMQQQQKNSQLQHELQKTVSTLDDQRTSQLSAYDSYAKELQSKLALIQQKCIRLQAHSRKYKSKSKDLERCLKQTHMNSSKDRDKIEFLEEEVRKQEILIQKYKTTEKQYAEIVQRQKQQIRDNQENWKKQRVPEKALRSQLDRLRHQLYLLRTAEVDRMEKVFSSFGLEEA